MVIQFEHKNITVLYCCFKSENNVYNVFALKKKRRSLEKLGGQWIDGKKQPLINA